MIETPERWSHEETVRHLLKEILVNQENQMAAIDNLKTNVAKLQADTATLIAGIPSEADVQAAADAVAAIDVTVVAATPQSTPAAS